MAMAQQPENATSPLLFTTSSSLHSRVPKSKAAARRVMQGPSQTFQLFNLACGHIQVCTQCRMPWLFLKHKAVFGKPLSPSNLMTFLLLLGLERPVLRSILFMNREASTQGHCSNFLTEFTSLADILSYIITGCHAL